MKRDDQINERDKEENEANKNSRELKKKGEGNKFDKVWKENLFNLYLPFLEKHCNLKLRKHEELTPKFQVTIEREVDFLRLAEDIEGNEFILHIEIQTKFEEKLIYRVKEYEALINRRYNLPVRTYIFYLGLDFIRIKTELPTEMVFSKFHLIPFCGISYEVFMESDNPEEIIIAILSDLNGQLPDQIIREILKKLEGTVQSKARLNKFVNQLQVLSQLRNLDNEVKQIASNMSIFPDIRKNAAVAPIIQTLEQEKSAIERDLKNEMLEFKRKTIQTLLEIGTFSVEEIASKTESSIKTVLEVKEETGL